MTVQPHGAESGTPPKRRVGAFLDWWLGELTGMLPGRLRRAARLERDILRLELAGDSLEIEIQSGRRIQPVATVNLQAAEPGEADAGLEAALGQIDLERVRVVLVLDDAKALRCTLTLPRAAVPELAELLEFEIERHTPFRADQVYFYYALGQAADADMIAVTLVVMPRRIVDPLMRWLAEHGLAPDSVTLSQEGLFPGAAARRLSAAAAPEPKAGRRLKLMAGLAAGLAVAAALSPVLRLSFTADRLAAAVEQASRDATATRALQVEADRLSLGLETVARAKAVAPSPLRILNALSTLLPDDTWLAQLGVAGAEVTLEGRTASSATLVGLIEASEMFDELSYLSPVTRDSGGAFERFNFSVKLSRR
jgi:general secretion pathway protein L